jgi:hypothetical protein
MKGYGSRALIITDFWLSDFHKFQGLPE